MTTTTSAGAPSSTPGAPTGVGTSRSGRSRGLPALVLVLAVTALIGSVLAMTGHSRDGRATALSPMGMTGQGQPGQGQPGQDQPGSGPGMMGAAGSMMAGRVWLAGDGVAVGSIATARARALQASRSAGLHPGEVIWFANGFYVELKNATGSPATEVLVDPVRGAVSTEPGPAMMWNTVSAPTVASTVSIDQARTIAVQWLAANRGEETLSAVDSFPGYYTAETTVDGTTRSMLSVNATTGAVWYHTWHGAFIAKEDA